MNPFMNPSLFASLSYHKTKLYNLFQAQAGTKIIPPLVEEILIILPWALRKKEVKEARDEARDEAREACNRL
jgi:hypothetical protein